jgi:hypothetical protein
MNIESTLKSLENFCKFSTGNTNSWRGKSAIYSWKKGKVTDDGTLNGVVRKLAGKDESGEKIWVVAGSFKISADGSIKRFTGLSVDDQKFIQSLKTVDNQVLETV